MWLSKLVQGFLQLIRRIFGSNDRNSASDTQNSVETEPEVPEPVEPIPDPIRPAPEESSPEPEQPPAPEVIVPAFKISEDHMIPVESGQAVSVGWTSYGDRKPWGVTWHWTATWDLAMCSKILGGANATRKGEASAHYGIGLSFEEGVDRYVSLENRSWHAGAGQEMRWDGKSVRHDGQWWSGARTTVGVETVNIGYARKGVTAQPDWKFCVHPNGKQEMFVPPWPEEQIAMMIAIGKEIVERWPHIKVRDHHGHHDICPGHKSDVCGFPFARVLRGIYDDPTIPDVWEPLWTNEQRQRALVALGYDLGSFGPNGDGVDGDWGRKSDAVLRDFQRSRGMVENGQWTTFVNWEVYDVLKERGIDLAEATKG